MPLATSFMKSALTTIRRDVARLDPAYSPDSPTLGANEQHLDALVCECKTESSLTGETTTFHFALATGRYKDNRIPPKGFRIAEAPSRLVEPVWHGAADTSYFTLAEYQGATTMWR